MMSGSADREYTLGDYRAPLGDIGFILNHVSGIADFDFWDREFSGEILQHAAKFVEGVIAPKEPVLDTQSPRMEDGRVKVSSLLKEIAVQYAEDGWFGLNVPEEFGGQDQPDILSNAVLEMICGASLNAGMLTSCPPAALKLLVGEGSEEQKARYVPGLVSGEYASTIVLSEAQAGSDLRLIRTTAKPDGNGDWTLEGGKVFCSNADHDITPNILHCILARTEGAAEGTRGLSLFLCPAVLPDGTRNNIQVTRFEDKMGIHATPTCVVNFDAAWAEMVGEPGEGLRRMFTMMNAMRLDVAVQGIGLCQIALQRGSAYAAERLQGRSLGKEANGDTVTINHHGDIKRMLQTMEAFALGGRTMVYRTAVELEKSQTSPLAAIMLPVCKVFVSDAANEAAHMAIQIHGGYGFCKEYQVEQIARDARITRIFEGANGLHATNVAVSLQKPAGQAAAEAFTADIEAALEAYVAETGRNALQQPLDDWLRASEAVENMSDPGMVAYDYMRLTGLTAFAAAWARIDAAAANAAYPARIKKIAAFVRDYMTPETEFLANRICGYG
tara:strand:- start:361 stop:2031 length:1671 start_codon:yes stop_codon:yes gene_type:complete